MARLFRIIADTLEFDGLPIATMLPSVWATRCDHIDMVLDLYDPDNEANLRAERDDLQDRVADLEKEMRRLVGVIDLLDARIYDLVNEDE